MRLIVQHVDVVHVEIDWHRSRFFHRRIWGRGGRERERERFTRSEKESSGYLEMSPGQNLSRRKLDSEEDTGKGSGASEKRPRRSAFKTETLVRPAAKRIPVVGYVTGADDVVKKGMIGEA